MMTSIDIRGRVERLDVRSHRSNRRRIAILASCAILIGLTAIPVRAQQVVDRVDSVDAWYDTISVTRPRFARATVGERLALAAFTALALPVGLTVGGLTIVPPTINALRERDRMHFGLAVGTGWGIGGDTTQSIYFPDFRVQFDIGYYPGRPRPILAHAAVLVDHRIASIHARDFVWLFVAGGAGVASDAHSYQPFVEGWFGALNAMGIRFAPLFPMHNLGLRARLGYDITAAKPWYELSAGLTSTFGF